MSRRWWLALFAFILITPALAQIAPIIRPITLPPRVEAIKPVVAEEADIAVEAWMTPESAKAAIEKLQAQRSELRLKLRDSDARLNEALARIDEMTRPSGSLVRAYCKDVGLSANTAGATENCGRYICGQVDGLCKKTCTVTSDCNGAYACLSGQCVTGEEAARMNGDG